MIQRVKANVAQRFDSTRAAESELVPLTLADDDSPRSMSSLDSPSFSVGNKGGGLQGKRLTYVGSPSDTMLSWPAAADAKMSQTRSSSPNDEVRAQLLYILAWLRIPMAKRRVRSPCSHCWTGSSVLPTTGSRRSPRSLVGHWPQRRLICKSAVPGSSDGKELSPTYASTRLRGCSKASRPVQSCRPSGHTHRRLGWMHSHSYVHTSSYANNTRLPP